MKSLKSLIRELTLSHQYLKSAETIKTLIDDEEFHIHYIPESCMNLIIFDIRIFSEAKITVCDFTKRILYV